MSATTDEQKMKLIDDLKTLVRDAKSLIPSTASDFKESAEEIKSSMNHKLNQAMEQIHYIEHCHREQLKHSAQKAQAYLSSHPLQAVGVSAFVGLLIGLLITKTKG